MFKHQGIWLPDGEKHFPDWMDRHGEIVDGRGTYQIRKFREAMKWCDSFCTAIDVGAHVGFWSIQLVKRFESVEAFEPVAAFRDCFRANLPPFDGQLHDCALGDYKGMVRMVVDPADSGGTHVGDEGDIPLRKLDEFDFQAVDFIKIDCEGFEASVVAGGERTIRENKPCIIVEQKPHKLQQNYGIKGAPAVDLLKSWGARVRAELSGDYILSWD